MDAEGAVKIYDALYVGYHNGIYEMYENSCMRHIKKYINASDRIFLSYAEVPEGVDGKEIEKIFRSYLKPKYESGENNAKLNVRVQCEGSCALFPKELLKGS